MPFEKNHNFSTGRPKGSTDKKNTQIRELFKLILEQNVDQIQADLELIEKPETRVKLLLDLAKFIMPTLKSIDTEVSGNLVYPLLNLGNGIDPSKIAEMTEAEIENIND